jgi:hypothetical protein
MKPFARRELVALNAALLAVLAVVTVWPAARSLLDGSPALAQANRPRGQYLVVSGDMTGPPSHAIYIMDTVNLEMIALRWERSKNDFIGLGYKNIAEDSKTAGGGR